MQESKRDLKVGQLESLKWKADERSDSLDTMYRYVTGQAEDAIAWYYEKKWWKKSGARATRLLAIMSIAVAGIIPILSQMGPSNGMPDIPPASASLALLLAVSLVGLDRFFGFSSAWMRFLSTALKMRNTLQLFKVEWEIKNASMNDEIPDTDQVLEKLEMCKKFLKTINTMLESEMDAWKQEFEAALKQIDDAVKAERQVNKMGGVKVTVKNADDFDNGWDISIDGGTPKKYAGKTAAFRDIVPGLHIIKVSSAVNNEKRYVEDAVDIVAGGISRVELEIV